MDQPVNEIQYGDGTPSSRKRKHNRAFGPGRAVSKRSQWNRVCFVPGPQL